MSGKIQNLSVRIVRYVDDSQPGWVACEFEDAEGLRHTVIDKVPVFTVDTLGADSTYPKLGHMPCEILGRWRDANGRDVARISLSNPLDSKSEEGLSDFLVLAAQLAV